MGLCRIAFFVIITIAIVAALPSTAAITHEAVSAREVASDAEAGLFHGDFFHAYRSYGFLLDSKTPAAAKIGLGGYLSSLFVIGGAVQIEKECDSFAESTDPDLSFKADYICGLHYAELKQTESAKKYLKRIPAASHFFRPAQVVLASVSIIANEPQQAIAILKPTERKQYADFELADQFDLTLARAYAAENKFEEALKYYQSVSGESKMYSQALEETAWVFFKMRRFESSQVLLDVLIGRYDSAQRLGEEQEISSSTYYRARYLKAYQALVEQRTEGAANEFAELRSEYEKALDKIKPSLVPAAVLSMVKRDNGKWTDVKHLPERVTTQLKYIDEWMGADLQRDYEHEIHFQMAISREVARAKKFKSIFDQEPDYVPTLESLQEQTWNEFSTRYETSVERLAKALNTLKIKAELGRLEIVWMKRAEGARTLDEVIDSYRQEVHSADEFVEQ